MANCIFAFPDRTLSTPQNATVLSGGLWDAANPLTNLQDTGDGRMSTLATSTNVLTTSTIIKGKFNVVRDVRLFAMLKHNASINGTARFLLYSDNAWTTPVYDSGVLPIWSTFYPPGASYWGRGAFMTGQITDEDRAGYQFDYYHVLPTMGQGLSYQVIISDTTNPAGKFSLARCIVAPGWQPAVNIGYDAQVQWNDPSTAIKSLAGVKWFNKKTMYRTAAFQLSPQSVEAAFGAWFELQRQLGTTEECYFVFDPDDTYQTLKMRSFLCTLTELSPLDFPYFNNIGSGAALEEVL